MVSIFQVAPREFPFAANCSEKEETRKISFLQEQVTNWIALAVWWSIKCFFAQNLLIFQIRLAEKWEGEEEQTQMQSAMHFMQKQ